MTDRWEGESVSLAQIDDEVGERLLDAPSPTGPPMDQASRLRAMVGAAEAGPDEARWDEPPARANGRTRGARDALRRTREAFVVTIASGKGGVGKTSVAVNLAVALAQRGLNTWLLDGDLGTANADVLCGVNPAARLEHVLTELPTHDGARRTVREIGVDAPGGFKLIPGAAGVARLADLSPERRAHLLEAVSELEREADVVIIDAAAGVGAVVTTLVNAADLGVIVATPEPTSVADAYALIKCARGAAAEGEWRPPALLINQAVDGAEARAVYGRIAAVCDRFLGFKPASLGWIAQDLRVAEAVRARRPVLLGAPSSSASRHIRDIAGRVAQRVGEAGATGPERERPTGLRALMRRWRPGRK